MIPSVVEIGSPGLYLSKTRGFLSIKDKDGKSEKLPLDNIGVLVITSPQATLSTALMNTLSERGIVAVLCDTKHRPASYLYPYRPHEELTGRLLDQIQAGKPLKKRFWQAIVKRKIIHQSLAIRAEKPHTARRLEKIASEVSSGDKENREAQAARMYWQALLGGNFRRIPRTDGLNSILDFGYGILRSAMLRAIAGSGINPSLGLAHINRRNPFCLADDLMEPFRPAVDIAVYTLRDREDPVLDSKIKRFLAELLVIPLSTSQGLTPLGRSMSIEAQSLAKSYSRRENLLEVPSLPDAVPGNIKDLWNTVASS